MDMIPSHKAHPKVHSYIHRVSNRFNFCPHHDENFSSSAPRSSGLEASALCTGPLQRHSRRHCASTAITRMLLLL